MNLIDALADHIGETYNTLAQGRPGQQARAWAQETQAKHDPMSVAMGFAPIGMTSKLKSFPAPYIPENAVWKKFEFPSDHVAAEWLDELKWESQAAPAGLVWDMGGFMPVSRMPLWEYVQYFLKHGVTPFALGGMMINNSKENKQ